MQASIYQQAPDTLKNAEVYINANKMTSIRFVLIDQVIIKSKDHA